MEEIKYEVSSEINKLSIMDIKLIGNRLLETATDYKKILRDVYFKVYETPEVTAKTLKGQFNYKLQKLSDISYDLK
tara:strand:- start:190 stop:417 length:228 start_codon:yes stop_codon:yes gene_type:complete